MSDLVLRVVDIDSVPVTEDNICVLAQARQRLLEAQYLVASVTGTPWPIATRLAPLSRAIDDFTGQVARLNAQPIDQGDPTTLADRLEERERCYEALDQARLAGMALMLHLNTALGYTLSSNKE